jgi:ribose 5-phosphate isomerase B
MPDEVERLVKLALERVLAREGRCGGGASAVDAPTKATPAATNTSGPVAVASDHGGFAFKQALVAHLREKGWDVRDLGPADESSCDYPDFAEKVARVVASGDAWRGIMVDGVGVGSAMAASKVPGVRAATCWDMFSVRNARSHNDANVLCLGGRVLGTANGFELARVFLDTAFEGGRHARRVDKIMAIERAALTGGRR